MAEVAAVRWPTLLNPVDDLPPATIITSMHRDGGTLVVEGVSHDNGRITSVSVGGRDATIVGCNAGVADWTATLKAPAEGTVAAFATDEAGNVEQTPHEVVIAGDETAILQ